MNKIDFVNQEDIYLDGEEWRDAPDILSELTISDRYEVSSYGRIRNKPYVKRGRNMHGPIEYTVPAKICRQSYSSDGYLKTHICRVSEGVRVKRSAGTHRLVAGAFLGLPTEERPVTNHLDSVRDNNFVGNLEWASWQENTIHSYKTGGSCNKGEKHPRSKFTWTDVREIRRLYEEENQRVCDIARLFDENHDTVWRVVTRKNWKE